MADFIKSIQFKKVSIPLKKPFVISLGSLSNAESVFVQITTESGICGEGECSPFITIQGETADTALVVAAYLKEALLGKDALDIAGNVRIMDSIIYGNTSIKSAFDIALYDIASQHAQMPLYKFLGGNNDKEIFTDYTVSIGSAADMAKDAQEIVAKGFPVIKVKLGRGGQQDVERIKAIREAVGMEIPVRIDANQGWEPNEAIDALKAMDGLNIQHCEEPILRNDFFELSRIRFESPIPIMCDESCSTVQDARRLYFTGACDRLNLKVGKAGGIYRSLEILKFAEEKNIPVQIGAFLESRLAMTAFAHVALASNSVQFFDFDTALMFSEDPIEDGIRYGNNGQVFITSANGLGAKLKDSLWKQ